MHHASFRSVDFQRSLADEPLAFCVDCHAPLARSREDVTGLDEGVGCASCHQTTALHAERPASEKPTTVTCKGCHEFAFPGKAETMQRTATEHARSEFAGVGCVGCHMPTAPGHHRSHVFAASRDPGRLREAIAMDGIARVPGGVQVRVRSVGVGHAFPTGDLYRALRVRVWTEDDEGRVLSDDDAELTRVFRDSRAGAGTASRVEERDDRLQGEPRALVFLVSDEKRVRRVHVTITYDRVADVRQGIRTLFDSTVLVDTFQELSP